MVVVVVAPPVTSTGSAQPAIALALPANAADVAGGLLVARLDVTMWCDAAMLLLPCCCAGKADDAAASDA